MKNQITILAVITIISFLCYCCSSPDASSAVIKDSVSAADTDTYDGYASQVAWGQHIATITGCGDCHTPKKLSPQGPIDDSSLLLSGFSSQQTPPFLMPEQLAKGLAATNDLTAWNGPWGTSYSANLTPDSTGIGAWSEDQFITCIRQGLYKGIAGARPIMPPMPISSLKNMTDDELKALFAYLKTIKPIHNIVPSYKPPVVAAK